MEDTYLIDRTSTQIFSASSHLLRFGATLMADETLPILTQHGLANDDWKFPLMLSFLAGASTSVGAAIVFVFSPAVIQRSMAFSLSLAASVMITVSVISIGPECMHGVIGTNEITGEILVETSLLFQRVACFGLGCFGYYLLSKLLVILPEPESFFGSYQPDSMENTEETGKQGEKARPYTKQESTSSSGNEENNSPSKRRSGGAVRRPVGRQHDPLPLSTSMSMESFESGTLNHEGDDEEKYKLLNPKSSSSQEERRRSWRLTMLLFVSLLCHNFPEGLAVVASTVESRELGITVAIGILIHNIPEGIAIAVPCMAARPDAPWLAFWLATVSGIAEPLGAVLALVALRSSESQNLPLENILACVAGIMCMVAVVELYPEALNHVTQNNYRGLFLGTLAGMFVMIATEWYLQ